MLHPHRVRPHLPLLVLTLLTVHIVLACGGSKQATQPDPMPEEDATPASQVEVEPEVLGDLPGMAMLGPYADVAAFCEELMMAECAEDEVSLVSVPSYGDTLTLRDGSSTRFYTVTAKNGDMQHDFVLFERAGALWTPDGAVLTYSPDDDRREQRILTRFVEDDENDALLVTEVNLLREVTAGGEAEEEQHVYYCRIGVEQEPGCVKVQVGTAKQASYDDSESVEEGRLYTSGVAGGLLDVTELPMAHKSENRQNQLLVPGRYRLVFGM